MRYNVEIARRRLIRIAKACRDTLFPQLFFSSEGFTTINNWLAANPESTRFPIKREVEMYFMASRQYRWVTLVGEGWRLQYCEKLYGDDWRLTGSRSAMENDTIAMMLSL